MPETQVKKETQPPHWDLTNIYGGLEAEDFTADVARLEKLLGELEGFIKEHDIDRLDQPPADVAATAETLGELLNRLNETFRLSATLRAYVYGFVTTDSYDKLASRRQSELEKLGVRVTNAYVHSEAWIGSLAPIVDGMCDASDTVADHRLAILDIIDESKYRMTTELEELASELAISGGGAMSKLHGTLTSQLKVPFERDGKTELLPITIVRNLSNDPDPDVRKRAYETEIEGWKSIRESVAFALNCVKGTANTLSKRRGLDDVLHASLELNKIDRETLDVLLASMKDSFPVFRKYFKSKAQKLGVEKLAWWDLFAPIGTVDLKYTWDETTDYVVTQFRNFCNEMADFAQNAFDKRWLDAEPRDGKRGGGFCMRIPKVEESRILVNFDGSFDQLSTVAHELGHAFHNYCQRGLPVIRRGSPMSLAETASIFCETIVFDAALKSAPPEARLPILENQLIGSSQVIVDIYSRFIFESEVLKRREKAELSADEFCEIMLDAQRQTYGDGVDENTYHPYMWLLKPHYYLHGLNFYNFPYAFGLLFGLGVYAVYKNQGGEFVPHYKELLKSTGEGKVSDLAQRFGIDVKSREFWDASLKVVQEQVEKYCGLEA